MLQEGNILFEEDIWLHYKQCKALPSAGEEKRETTSNSFLHERWQIFRMFNSAVLDLLSWGEVLALQMLTSMLLPAPVKLSGGRTHGSREGIISSSVLQSEVFEGDSPWILNRARSLSSYSPSSILQNRYLVSIVRK